MHYIAKCLLLVALCNALQSECHIKYGSVLTSRIRHSDALHTPISVWILFIDKPFPVTEIKTNVHPKATQRRLKVPQSQVVEDRDWPVSEDYIKKVLERAGSSGALRSTSRWLNAISIKTSLDSLSRIADLPFVKEIEIVVQRSKPRLKVEEMSTWEQRVERAANNSFDLGDSYDQLQQISAIEVLQDELGNAGHGVRILVIDSGYYVYHESFEGMKIVAEYDFIHDINGTVDNIPGEDVKQAEHGTAVLSLLGGKSDGKLYGLAYNAQYLLAKTEVLASETIIEEDYFVEAIEWGELNGADIISASLGYTEWYTPAQVDGKTAITTKAINVAVSEKGMVAVISAGNEGERGIAPPGDSPYAITVGAVNKYGKVAPFSSRGPTYDGVIKPDVCALGAGTFSADFVGYDKYKYSSGTSMSTPLVAGLVALILSLHPSYTPAQVKQAIQKTASNHDNPNNNVGWGILNATGAILAQPELCPNSCGNGACIDATCVCDIDYFGSDCSYKKSGCPKTCFNGGCSNDYCKCFEGWTGVDCSEPYIGNVSRLYQPFVLLSWIICILLKGI